MSEGEGEVKAAAEEAEEVQEAALERAHDAVCAALTVDAATVRRSWDEFRLVRARYTLEGDPMHWISCALYVACRTSITPTVQTGKAVEGNCVSLTKLLRLCNISLIQFFNKIKMWMEMASIPEDFRLRIEQLERKFAVSTVLFQKFQPIFQDLFVGLTNEPAKTTNKGTKKHKLTPCTVNSLFEMTWCLFVCAKGEFHSAADDLVDMYHLLLSCLDYVFANAYMSRRTDLINPAFQGLPKEWNSDNIELPDEPPCIMAVLCKMREGLPLEASTTKEYVWRPVVQRFFNKNIIKGDKNNLTGILEVANFDSNLKSLNNLYETYVLSAGEFDERIFLGEHANDVGTLNKISGDEISKAIAMFGTNGRANAPDTPLTGRRYLRNRTEPMTPVSAATHSIARLQAYLAGCKTHPSSHLWMLFKESGVEEETVKCCVIEPCKRWSELFLSSFKESSVTSKETAIARCNMVTMLHYKILEHILREERRKKPQVPLKMLVSQEMFQRTLYACCTEVVLQAYGTHSVRFPWVLRTFSLHAFHFYKIIELVVQAVMDKLSRDIVKHLNAVEEQALEAMVWTSDSPLWDRLAPPASVPPSVGVYSTQESNPASSPSPALQARRTPLGHGGGGMLSPVSSVSDRFLSPLGIDQAKKQLFKDPAPAPASPATVKPGQSLLVQSGNGVIMSPGGTHTPGTPDKKTSKAGSSVLFFRKFYSLAVVRMNDLCMKLGITDSELKRKIWTCVEHSITHQTHLMKDRHLDQLLMCAIYVICRVSNSNANRVERSFTEIMRCYRQQPQARNHVYRSVFITNEKTEDTPERGDLIYFYNKVYVQHMQTFAMRFTGKQKDECSLSPLPAGRGDTICASPLGQRVSDRHRLYVKPLTTPPPANTQLTYKFSRSPNKDLRAINSLVACDVSVSGVKRAVDGVEPAIKRVRYGAPGVTRKLHGLIIDRQAV